MSDHLRRANDELDGAEHRPSAEEILPPTDAEVAGGLSPRQEALLDELARRASSLGAL